MITNYGVIYYIGGPRDCVKEGILGQPLPEIKVLEPLKLVPPYVGMNPPEFPTYQVREHRYMTRRVAQNIYVAIHEAAGHGI